MLLDMLSDPSEGFDRRGVHEGRCGDSLQEFPAFTGHQAQTLAQDAAHEVAGITVGGLFVLVGVLEDQV